MSSSDPQDNLHENLRALSISNTTEHPENATPSPSNIETTNENDPSTQVHETREEHPQADHNDDQRRARVDNWQQSKEGVLSFIAVMRDILVEDDLTIGETLILTRWCNVLATAIELVDADIERSDMAGESTSSNETLRVMEDELVRIGRRVQEIDEN